MNKIPGIFSTRLPTVQVASEVMNTVHDTDLDVAVDMPQYMYCE